MKPNLRTTPLKRPLQLLSISVLLAADSLFAQAVAPAPAASTPTTPNAATAASEGEENTVVLSPFEVTAGGDNGYSAATTLAGNRLNTSLRDIGSAISVVTEQFLKDTGAFNNETLLQYTTNTEIGSIYGNFSGANGVQGTQLEETGRFVAPNMNTRVRGLAAADNTIDFFLTDIPWDSYAVDRIDMQRGPNAILFGLGQPGGIINANTKQAGFRNRGSVELRYSSFNSLRTTLDYNHVLVPKQLAVRIAALRNDEKFQQKPAFQRDERLFGTLRYEPGFLNKTDFAKTTLRINGESGRVRSNRPRSVPPGDGITPFFYTGTAQGYDSSGNPFTYNNINGKGFDARGLQDTIMSSAGRPDRGEFQREYRVNGNGATIPNPYFQPWLGGQFAAGYFGNPMAIFEANGTQTRLANWEPNTGLITAAGTTTPLRGGLNSAGVVQGGIDGIPGSRMSSLTIYRDWARKTNQPGAKFGLTRNLILNDASIFDFYDNLIDGPNKSEWQNFDRFNANLSQTLFHGKVGFEAVFDQQHYDNGQLVFMSDKGQVVYIDPIRIMADGTPNPNFGRPFIGDGIGGNRHTYIDRESQRYTGFVKHDFTKSEHKNLFTRALGRHILTAFYNDDERRSDTRGFQRYGTDLGYKNFAFGPNTNQNQDSSNRQIYPIVYLGDSLAGRSSAAGANISRPTGSAIATSGNVRIFDSTWTGTVSPGDPWINTDYPEGHIRRNSTQSENPANYRGWVNQPITVVDSEQGNRDALTNNANLTKSTVESQAYVWNGHFWDGGLVGMFGWRRDISKAWSYAGERFPAGPASNANINLDPSVYRLPVRYRDYIDEESHSWSIVAHLTQLLPRSWDRLPVDVSVFYNQSENFAASAGRVGPLNDPLGPPRGITKDMGLMLATKDGKYSLRFNKYESESTNASSGGFNAFYLPGVFTSFHNQYNVFKYKIDGNLFNLSGTQGMDAQPNRWTWQPRANQTPEQAVAEQAASIAAWEQMIAALPPEFFTAYRMNIGVVEQLTSTAPAGFTVTEDNTSKGMELELSATPVRNLRLSFNVGKQEAFRRNIGPDSLTQVISTIHTALATTPAGNMRSGSGSTAATALTEWNNNLYAQYAPLKFTENTAVPELRKWRANFVANYDFREGLLKNVNVGGAYRWQSKVVIGYPPDYLDAAGNPAVNPQVALVWRPRLSEPFYGPAENNIDLWIGYKRPITKKITWRAQLNVRNVGKGNYLIPINVQPDGTPVGYRIGAPQLWSLTNTFEF